MLNWKAKAKGQRTELERWRSGDYFLHPTKCSDAQRAAYKRPWWSKSSRSAEYPHTAPCVMCGDPFVQRNGNVCDSCWRDEVGE